MLNPSDNVRRLKQYHPPLGGRTGLRLDFNENTEGCSPRVLDRLRQISADDLSRYPERGPVEAMVAGWLGVSPSQLLLTNGVDEAIHLLCQTYLQPGDEALVVVPTFSMYQIYAEAAGAQVISIPAADDFRFPTEAVLARLSPRTRLIAIANPNNPTGVVVARRELLDIVVHADGAAVLVDEAYFDFYGESVIDQAGRRENLFVARTFSKAYGMAGLRAGALAGSAAQMEFVRRVTSPYNVNAVALACLPAAISDRDYVRSYVDGVQRGRARLESELHSLGIPFWPSQANFVLARLGTLREAFILAMRRRGILVRDRHTDPGCAGCVRITVGTEEHTARLIGALRESVEEIGRGREVRA